MMHSIFIFALQLNALGEEEKAQATDLMEQLRNLEEVENHSHAHAQLIDHAIMIK
jgi:hypothetical protein